MPNSFACYVCCVCLQCLLFLLAMPNVFACNACCFYFPWLCVCLQRLTWSNCLQCLLCLLVFSRHPIVCVCQACVCLYLLSMLVDLILLACVFRITCSVLIPVLDCRACQSFSRLMFMLSRYPYISWHACHAFRCFSSPLLPQHFWQFFRFCFGFVIFQVIGILIPVFELH